MLYLKAMAALLALLWSWALSPDDPPEDPPNDDDDDGDKDEPYRILTFNSEKEEEEHYNRKYRERDKRTRDKIREEEQAKLKDEREKAERKAREDALQEQGEYKTIADQRQETIVQKDATISDRDARIEELEAEVEALGTHRKANEERAASLMENVPESVKELLADRDPLKQLEWLDKNPELAGLETNTQGRKPRGSRETGRPSRNVDEKPSEEQEKRQRARTTSAF